MQNSKMMYDSSNFELNIIQDYYSSSKLFKNNQIITSTTNFEKFEKYCSDNSIHAFDLECIDSVAAVTIAAKMGNTPLLEKLVKKIGTKILNTSDLYHLTPLHILCNETTKKDLVLDMEQLYKGAKKLLELGANPNIYLFDIPSQKYLNPLHRAATNEENVLLINLLMQYNARAFGRQRYRETKICGESFIQENIYKAKKIWDVTHLLSLAKQNKDSYFSILPSEISKEINKLFLSTMKGRQSKLQIGTKSALQLLGDVLI